MALMRWEPFRELADLRREMERIFDQFLEERPARKARGAWLPTVDIYERNDHFVVRADIPGVRPENIDVSVQDDVLTIHGERKHEEEVRDEKYYRAERRFGSFERTVMLPPTVDRERVKATFDNGVLEVTPPKLPQVQPKKVEIEVKPTTAGK